MADGIGSFTKNTNASRVYYAICSCNRSRIQEKPSLRLFTMRWGISPTLVLTALAPAKNIKGSSQCYPWENVPSSPMRAAGGSLTLLRGRTNGNPLSSIPHFQESFLGLKCHVPGVLEGKNRAADVVQHWGGTCRCPPVDMLLMEQKLPANAA